MAQAWVRATKRAIHHEVRKRQCKTGRIQLRTTATRTIKRHALNRTVNRQSSGAILAELKHRLYALLGAVCGIAAAGFVRGLHLLENLFDKIRERYTRHIIGMLLVGILMYALLRSYGQYYVDGVGYATVQAILLGQLSAAGLLLLLFFCKLLATSLSLGSGSSGGIFSPSLFMGANQRIDVLARQQPPHPDAERDSQDHRQHDVVITRHLEDHRDRRHRRTRSSSYYGSHADHGKRWDAEV